MHGLRRDGHSVREMCGTDDVGIAYKTFLEFYFKFTAIDKSVDNDA